MTVKYKNAFLERQHSIYAPYFNLFLIIFFAAILSKGLVLFRGYSIDDYGREDAHLIDTLISQGRYVAAVIYWAIDAAGINLSDVYFSTGILGLLLESAFIVSILRFVGLANRPSAGLAGALIVAHPYLTEVFTFRLLLPIYCFVLICSIVTLEAITQGLTNWRSKMLALLGVVLMVFSYQSLLNYFAVAIVILLMNCQLRAGKINEVNIVGENYRARLVSLTLIVILSVVIYFIVTTTVTHLGLAEKTVRANLLGASMVGQRLSQSGTLLAHIYWNDEPTLNGWPKILIAVALFISIVTIFSRMVMKGNGASRLGKLLALLLCVSLAPISMGLILPFSDWWPVPRVIAHVGAITGLVFLLADVRPIDNIRKAFRILLHGSQLIILLIFVFLSNQILADQQRLNEWDKMKASRIIARLEIEPGFKNVRFVHISGGLWGYPSKLRMLQGDMNVSAFYVDYSKVSLLAEVSGYWLERSFGAQVTQGEAYCKNRKPWPDSASTAIFDNLAIVCLDKAGV